MTPTHHTDDAVLDPPVEIPAGETPACECAHCGRPFGSERARDLHMGEHHADDLDRVERDAVEAAKEAERDDLFFFHIKTVVALGVIYSAMVILYMVAIQSGFI